MANSRVTSDEAFRALKAMEIESLLDEDRAYDLYKKYRDIFYSVKMAYNFAKQDIEIVKMAG